MTAAFAGLAGNAWPVKPHALPQEEQGWWDWLFNGPDSYSDRMHDDMQQMLRAAVNRGTGRAARLSIPQYGKTGTSQDNRDAVFIGYAGDLPDSLIVGVWVGNDDNSPLDGTQGGGLPARIWKRFMAQAQSGAVKTKAAPKKQPAKANIAKPEPADDEAVENIEGQIGETEIQLNEQDGLIISTEIDGQEVELNIGGEE
jgi:penicillin-binding protein 1A